MNKKTIFNSIKIIAAGILLSGAISYAHTPIVTTGNASTPVHVNVAQTKTGTLGVGPIVVNGISQFLNTVNILGLNPNAPTGVPVAPAPPMPPSGGGGGSSAFLDQFLPNKVLAGSVEICGNNIDDNNNNLIDEGCGGAGYFEIQLSVWKVTHPDNSVTTYCDPAVSYCAGGRAIEPGDKITLKWNVVSKGNITFGSCARQFNSLSPISNASAYPSSGWSGNVSTLSGTKDVTPVTIGVMHQFVIQCYDNTGVFGGLAYTNVYIKNESDLNVLGKLGVGVPSPAVALDVAGNIRIGNTFGGGAGPGVCSTNTGHLLSC